VRAQLLQRLLGERMILRKGQAPRLAVQDACIDHMLDGGVLDRDERVGVFNPSPSVPMTMRQTPPWSLPLRAEVTSSHGHAAHPLRKDSCRWLRNRGRP